MSSLGLGIFNFNQNTDSRLMFTACRHPLKQHRAQITFAPTGLFGRFHRLDSTQFVHARCEKIVFTICHAPVMMPDFAPAGSGISKNAASMIPFVPPTDLVAEKLAPLSKCTAVRGLFCGGGHGVRDRMCDGVWKQRQ